MMTLMNIKITMAAIISKNKTSLQLEIVHFLDNFTKYICQRIQYDVIDS